MQPFFLEGRGGPLFALYHPPLAGEPRAIVVHCPAFAEEMNKSRRMVALQARAFVEQGLGTLVFDLFGTGDSAGDFGDATWDGWLADVRVALDWAGARCARVALWGLRGGALLAGAAAREAGDAVAQVLLWQPVLNGEVWLSQFLRLRTAAALFRGGEKETVKDLQGRLLSGETVEVAGYRVGPALAAGLLGSSLTDDLTVAGRPVAWLEVTSGEGRELPPASARTTDALTQGGVPVRSAVVGGEPFWSTQEIAVAPELIRATAGFL